MVRRGSSRSIWGTVLVWVGCPLAAFGFFALGVDILDYVAPALGGTLPLWAVLFWTLVAAAGSGLAVVGDRARHGPKARPAPA